ncbi:MAG: YceI family protein, partial [Deltaproteobacteria bacterium]|nr:YceI family protein [Deltaproteobacteria bacterium]
PGCDIASLSEGAECQSALSGKLTIRGNERPARLEVRIARRSGSLDVSGSTTVNWADFNVEDPSILVARLDRAVQIHVHTVLPE